MSEISITKDNLRSTYMIIVMTLFSVAVAIKLILGIQLFYITDEASANTQVSLQVIDGVLNMVLALLSGVAITLGIRMKNGS